MLPHKTCKCKGNLSYHAILFSDLPNPARRRSYLISSVIRRRRFDSNRHLLVAVPLKAENPSIVVITGSGSYQWMEPPLVLRVRCSPSAYFAFRRAQRRHAGFLDIFKTLEGKVRSQEPGLHLQSAPRSASRFCLPIGFVAVSWLRVAPI
ncbi:hypothetical protein L596_014965 [Steinernema carpocapsae]|uniref:Uncharacterized protein n=1 Tax=Steinernema carpocapsae TaxID=34508 RepID=A0A4U5NDG8_STECR|nr:hypothetical protein L596_014965 [Steinernema carpocapsae]